MNTFNETKAKTGVRATQAEATREAVLAAARDEFDEVGFEAASVRSIARRAGVSPGTVIHHHGEKRELLYAALFDELDGVLTRTLAKVPEGVLEVQFDHVTAAVFRFYKRRPGLSRTLLKESLFAEGPWAERFTLQTATVHARLAGLVQEAKGRGELRSDVEGPLVAVAYLSFFYFGLISWCQGALPKPDATVGRLFRQHLDGLRPAASRLPRSVS